MQVDDVLRMLTGLEVTGCVLIPPCTIPPPAGAWIPQQLSFQLVLHGQIPTTPWCDEAETIVRRGGLICCAPGAASTRRYNVAREHLALSVMEDGLEIHHYRRLADDDPERALQARCRLPLPPTVYALAQLLERGFQHVLEPSVLAELARQMPALLVHGLQQRPAGLFERAMHWLEQHACTDLDRNDLAHYLNCHPDHVTRLFRQTGSSFVDERRRLRCQRACALLQHEPADLTSVARACGFNSETYLIRSFKKVYGCTPGQWRQRQHLPA